MTAAASRLVTRTRPSPVGTLRLLADDTHLRRIDFAHSRRLPALPGDAETDDAGHPVLDAASRQLDRYFAGRLTAFDLPLRPEGTAFQRSVWAELRRIPYGVTTTYGRLAATLGRPDAARAVGLANARNPLSIVVPCHRVVGADGGLTGFAGGIDTKRRLLRLEQPGLFQSV
ncbi:MAG: methylated-DNA--[protein]-cysteine S-methyltransferase [Planctomycetota bacterium]